MLYVAMGFGSVLGTFIVGRFVKLDDADLSKTIGIAVVWDGLCLVLFSRMNLLWMGALFLLLRELGFSIWRTAQQTELMKETVDSMRGRVFATHETISALLMMTTMVMSGPAIDYAGHQFVTTIAGLIVTVAGIIWIIKVVFKGDQFSKRQSASQTAS